MSSNKHNPFTPVGRYFIETYLYEHKKSILLLTIAFIVVLFGMAVFVWDQGHQPPISGRAPLKPSPPRYGYGPYGYGLYAPPRALLENPPDM